MSNKTIEQRIEEFVAAISAVGNNLEYYQKFPDIYDEAFGIELDSKYHRMAKYREMIRNIALTSLKFGRELERERAKVLVNGLLWIKDKAPFCDCMDAPALAKEALKAYEESGK